MRRTPHTEPAPKPLPPFLPKAPPLPRFVAEPARNIPVIAEADVAVLGGGPAGLCAAVAAARSGASVVIVERHAYFGGMACAANVNIWHRLYSRDHAVKVAGGLPEEALLRLERMNAVRNWHPSGRGDYTICTEAAKLAFDDMALGSGVQILFHSWLAGCITDSAGRVEAAIIESKSGRGALRAAVFIDCTGDADLVHRAGVPTTTGGAQGQCQPPTLCFRVAGINAEKAREAGIDGRAIQQELFRGEMDYNGGKYPCHLWSARNVFRPDEVMFAGTRVIGVDCSRTDDFTRAEVEARYQMRWVLETLRKLPGYENMSLVDIGAQIGVRETRRIIGEHQIQERELLEGLPFEDTIAQGSYPVDIHNPLGPGIHFKFLDGTEQQTDGHGTTRVSRWDSKSADDPLRTTPCYCVPYRALIPRGLSNVLVAGRCISSTHEAAGALRVMINAMSFGHAAGLAASMAVSENSSVRAVNILALRSKLKDDGVPLVDVPGDGLPARNPFPGRNITIEKKS